MINKNGQKHICMFVANDVINDPRVQKEAEWVTKAGFKVVVVGLKTDRSLAEEHRDGYTILRIRELFKEAVKKFFSKFLSISNKIGQNNVAKNRDGGIVGKNKLINYLCELFYLINLLIINISLARAGRKLGADIYHANDADTLFAAYLASRKNKKTFVYDAHEVWFQSSPCDQEGLKWMRKWLSFIEKCYAKKAKNIITVNDSIAKEMVKRYAVALPLVIKNCPKLWRVEDKVGVGLRGILKIDRGTKIILYQGRYVSERGLEELIESAKYIRDNVLIVFRGYGSIENLLREKVKENNLEARVKFVVPVSMEELISSASDADVGVIPYKSDFFKDHNYALPNKFFEYLMAGLAVAASNLPEITSIIEKEKIGLTFNPDDPKDIAQKINDLTEDEARLEQFKENALKAARTKYNWQIEGKKLIDIYKAFN